MKMNLAVLDWVNCFFVYLHANAVHTIRINRAHTSQRRVADLQRPDHCTQMNVLVENTFRFVDIFWASYICHNKSDLWCVVAYCVWLIFFSIIIIRPLVEEYEENDEDELIRDGTLVDESDEDDAIQHRWCRNY